MDRQEQENAWKEVPEPARIAMAEAWSCDVPPLSTALYSRWWQLETWTRTLVYLELRSRDGVDWLKHLSDRTVGRGERDKAFPYMNTPDGSFSMTYLDVSDLFNITLQDDNWALFSPTLVAKYEWKAEVERLTRIRHRIGHCRRPHVDDLARVEQALRDMEPGAFKAVAAYNEQRHPVRDEATTEELQANPLSMYLDDPMVDGWIRKDHHAAKRLIEHAESKYDVQFRLNYSHRPWAERRAGDEPISGKPGYLWHATWWLGRGSLDLRKFWKQIASIHETVIFVSAPTAVQIEVTFAAVDDPVTTADAIGQCFDALITSSNTHREIRDEEWEHWESMNQDLDNRVLVTSPLTFIDESTPVSLFRS